MMEATMPYHTSVMLHESIDALKVQADGRYMDATYGGGGHSRSILEKLSDKGRLIAFDRDASSQAQGDINDSRLTLIAHDYKYALNYCKYLDMLPLDGILIDAGVSGHQFDQGDRGFSFRFHGPLDMRMDADLDVDARQILKNYTADQLAALFRKYGELPNAWTLAQAIVAQRTLEAEELSTTWLADVIRKVSPPKEVKSHLAQVFQSLRIEVNDEITSLRILLDSTPSMLAKGGRLVALTYHSLEDRMVKELFATGSAIGIDPEKSKVVAPEDYFGGGILPFKALNRTPLLPTEEEVNANPRSRSAKMRVGIKR